MSLRKVKTWSTVRDWPSGFHNPRTNITVKDRRGFHVLEGRHGTSDDVEVYRNGDDYYVLSMRPNMPYVGLARYNAPAAHKPIAECHSEDLGTAARWPILTPHLVDNEVFAQGDDQVADCLGSHDALSKLAPATVARRLLEWID